MFCFYSEDKNINGISLAIKLFIIIHSLMNQPTLKAVKNKL